MPPGISSGSKDGDVANLDPDAGDSDRQGSKAVGDEHHANRERRLSTGDSSSRLEKLPAELRSHVLMSSPGLSTLRSLVHASPVLHAQYRHDRNNILRACLARELDGLVVDASATVMSRVSNLGAPRTDEMITAFLDTYRGLLSGSTPPADVLESLKPGNVHWLAAFHLCVARPLASQYSKWALVVLSKAASSLAVKKEDAGLPAVQGGCDTRLSRSEEIRILRAIYRYETFQHLFGRNHGNRHGGFRDHEINELFFSLFDPWEVEAIGCFEIFVSQSYEDIFDRVAADLHDTNPRFTSKNGIFNPSGSFDLVAEHDDYLDGTISRGLKMTVRLLAIDDHENLVAKMEQCLTHAENLDNLDDPMSDVLGVVAQDDRREMSTNGPTARDEAEQRRDPIRFVGDAVPPDGPPLAWVLLWGGKYANIYGKLVPKLLRRWGYVMWDERRWTAMGAERLVARQWETASKLVNYIKNLYGWSPIE